MKIPFKSQPVQNSVINVTLTNKVLPIYEQQLNSLCKIGAISECISEPGEFLSPYFLRVKPNGSYRFILNLKQLNVFIEAPHFKLEDYRSVTRLLTCNSKLANIDLKDAYYLISIHKKYRKYLRFKFNGKLFQFNCLPFGLNIAPWLFTKLLKPVITLLRQQSIMCVIYLDDILIMGSSKSKCLLAVNKTINLLQNLGFIINREKSNLIPSKELTFLGYTFNTSLMSMHLPLEKSAAVRNSLITLRKHPSCTIRHFASVIGKLVAACPAIAYGWVHIKVFERAKYLLLKHHNKNYNTPITLPPYLNSDLDWWIRNITQSSEKIEITKTFSTVIFSDASKSGWGAHCGGSSIHGFWSTLESKEHINALELLASFYGLKSFAKSLERCNVLLQIDNTTAIACINKKGSVQFKKLNDLTRKIWDWCESRRIYIFASYIPTKENIHADKESRCRSIETEYELKERRFLQICRHFGTPKIDLFATALNKKCPIFASWGPDPDSSFIDAFTFKWTKYFYAFPPFPLIARCLNKIIHDNATGVVIVPNWPSQNWFPLFNKLLIDTPLVFTPEKDLLLSPFRDPHPLHKTLTLIAGKLSSNPC